MKTIYKIIEESMGQYPAAQNKGRDFGMPYDAKNPNGIYGQGKGKLVGIDPGAVYGGNILGYGTDISSKVTGGAGRTGGDGVVSR